MPYLDPAAGKRRESSGAAAVTVANLTEGPGTANGTVVDVGASFNQTTLNDNFRDVTAKLNALLTECRKHGIIG
jgi:hypothetical protein